MVAKRYDDPLTDTTAEALNRLMQSVVDGTHPDVKDSRLSKNTVEQHQSMAQKLYRYQSDLGADSERIVIFRPKRTPVDDRDMFEPEEVEAMRDAIDNPRDRACSNR